MHGALKTKPPNLHRHNDGQPEVQKCVNVWNIRQSNEGLTSSNQVKLGNQNGFDSNMDKLYMINYIIILKDIIYIYILYISVIIWIHCWSVVAFLTRNQLRAKDLRGKSWTRRAVPFKTLNLDSCPACQETLDMNCIFISKTS